MSKQIEKNQGLHEERKLKKGKCRTGQSQDRSKTKEDRSYLTLQRSTKCSLHLEISFIISPLYSFVDLLHIRGQKTI